MNSVATGYIHQFDCETHLQLNLCKQGLTTVPDEVLELNELEFLWLEENRIDAIPYQIRKLQNLKVLSLYKNKIQDLPLQLYQLKNLERKGLLYS